jgi:hypothetical protein
MRMRPIFGAGARHVKVRSAGRSRRTPPLCVQRPVLRTPQLVHPVTIGKPLLEWAGYAAVAVVVSRRANARRARSIGVDVRPATNCAFASSR